VKQQIKAIVAKYTSEMIKEIDAIDEPKAVEEDSPSKKKQPRLAIVVGHNSVATGAYAVKPISKSEYAFNSILAADIAILSTQKNVEVDVFLRDEGGVVSAYEDAVESNPDAIIELHFNAYNGRASGTETLYVDEMDDRGLREKELAQSIQYQMVKALDLPDRGVKDRDRHDRGFRNLTQTYKIPSILIEPFFGDNPNDSKIANARRVLLADSILFGFLNWTKAV
jgi:N-acetylmuramoyl-L-alanine amidase